MTVTEMDWDREYVTTLFMHLGADVFASPVLKSWFKSEDFQVNTGEDLFHIFDNFQHNYGLINIIQLFLYLSLDQRR